MAAQRPGPALHRCHRGAAAPGELPGLTCPDQVHRSSPGSQDQDRRESAAIPPAPGTNRQSARPRVRTGQRPHRPSSHLLCFVFLIFLGRMMSKPAGQPGTMLPPGSPGLLLLLAQLWVGTPLGAGVRPGWELCAHRGAQAHSRMSLKWGTSLAPQASGPATLVSVSTLAAVQDKPTSGAGEPHRSLQQGSAFCLWALRAIGVLGLAA